MMAQHWDETTLMAYVDGQLDAETARAIDAALANDTEAQALVAHLRLGATAVAGAFDGSLRQPVPPPLLRTAMAGTRQKVSVARSAWWRVAAALAVVTIGITAVQMWRGNESRAVRLAGQTASADQQFQAALMRALRQTTADGSVTYGVPGANRQGRVMLLGPVDSPLGVPCRAFRHEPAAADQAPLEGLACQASDGSWSVLTLPIPTPSLR